MKKTKLIFFILIPAIAIGIILIAINHNFDTVDSPALDLGIPIQLEQVAFGNLQESIHYEGIMEPKSTVSLSPIITAEVEAIYVQAGDFVEAGTVIGNLDATQLIANKATLESKSNTAQINYDYLKKEVTDYYTSNPSIVTLEKIKSEIAYLNNEKSKMQILLLEGAISQNTYDELEQRLISLNMQLNETKYAVANNYDTLKNQQNITKAQIVELNSTINELNLTIQKTELLSPISGTVRAIYYQPGDLAAAGKPFVIIDDKSEMTVSVSVTEKDLSYIKKGGKVKLTTIDGTTISDIVISRISPYMNSVTKMNDIEIDIQKDKASESMVIGASVDVEFILSEVYNKPIISKDSLIKQLDATYVYVIQKGVAKKTKITTGLEVEDKIVVLSGLKKGQEIASKNLTSLYDGAHVYVYEGVKNQ